MSQISNISLLSELITSFNTLDNHCITEMSEIRSLKKEISNKINNKITQLLSGNGEEMIDSELLSLQTRIKEISDNNVQIARIDELIDLQTISLLM